jgi:predicted DNA-binding transcriptional regulator AlpA
MPETIPLGDANGTAAELPHAELPHAEPGPATLADVLRELRKIAAALDAQLAAHAAGPQEWIDAQGAAHLLGLSRSTFFRLVAAKKLPKPVRLGKQVRRWSRRALLEAMATK